MREDKTKQPKPPIRLSVVSEVPGLSGHGLDNEIHYNRTPDAQGRECSVIYLYYMEGGLERWHRVTFLIIDKWELTAKLP